MPRRVPPQGQSAARRPADVVREGDRASTRTGERGRHEFVVLGCCLGAGFGTLIDSSSVNYAVPSVQASLGASTQQIQWFLAAYSLTFGLGLVPAGRIGDRCGRKIPLVLGLLCFLIGGVIAVAAGSVWWSVAGRAMQGIGGGTISAQVLGIIQDEFRGMARIRALSAYGMASAASAFAGPLLSAAALQLLPPEWSWRGILALNMPFVAATLVLACLYRPETTSSHARAAPTGSHPSPRLVSLDLPAVGLLGALVVVLTLPVIDPVLSRHSLWLLLIVPVLVVTLVLWERHYAATSRLPLFVPELMRSSGYVRGSVVAMLWFGAILAKSTVLTLYLLSTTSLSPIGVALLFVPGALARLWSANFGSRAYSRLGARAVPASMGLELFAAVLLLVATWDWGGGPGSAEPRLIWATIAFGVLSGIGSGITEPVLRAVTLDHAPEWAHGVAASFLQLVQRLAATFFVALATGLLLSRDDAFGLTLGVAVGVGGTAAAWALALGSAFRLRTAPEQHAAASGTAVES
ncbi:MFS transporter [Pseudoclavibacter sp. CFCC 14310]|uniref:MFS transporter n=1 Tax=Pseudoclavibacter sp. CFCC 14310 TaxID=2615180 RepID=UPI001300DD16|nr:MFS transporter [Pseudoclavibacter sp. CFCC 14310]KAB1644464.1 MFS transporter [Pseudoclavibacter sp. CFCC 14310]